MIHMGVGYLGQPAILLYQVEGPDVLVAVTVVEKGSCGKLAINRSESNTVYMEEISVRTNVPETAGSSFP